MNYPDTNRKIDKFFEYGKLPTMVYVNKQSHDRKTVLRPLHRHDSICEILLVYKGVGTYHIDGKSYPLSEGSVIFYNQGSLHEVVSETENEIGDYCIGVTNLHLKELPVNHLVKEGEPFVRDSGHLFPMLKSICEHMYELEGTNEEGKLSAQLLCATFITLTTGLDSCELVSHDRNENELMALKIRNYLNAHFIEDVTLEMVGEALGVSATYVSHTFKKATGRTPISYIIRRRIGHAQTLLISTDYSTSMIASMVGYDNTNYFSTLFSKTVGMSPSKYREFYKEEMRGISNQS